MYFIKGLHKAAQASLSSGINLAEAVKLPEGEDINEWIAVHVVDFFNRINLIYGTVCDYCTEYVKLIFHKQSMVTFFSRSNIFIHIAEKVVQQ